MNKKFVSVFIGASMITANVFASTPYDDVPRDHWAYDAVEKLTKDGVIEGYGDGTNGNPNGGDNGIFSLFGGGNSLSEVYYFF